MKVSEQAKLELLDDKYCFVCGDKNPQGLKLKFILEGETLKTSFIPDKRYQGYANIVHGGIIGAVLDEMLVNLPWMLGIKAVTAEYTVRLKKPVKVGERLDFTSRIKENKGRLLITEAEAAASDGTIVATATGKCVRV